MDGRAGEVVLAAELERERGGLFERGEIESIRELARGGFEVTTREHFLAELHLDLGHREERRAAPIVLRQESRKEITRFAERLRIAARDGRGHARLDRFLHLAEHVERAVFVVARVAEIAELVGRWCERDALCRADRFDDVIGRECRAHRARRVHRHVGDMQIPGRRGEHDRDDPRVSRNAANAPHVAHVEEPPEIRTQRFGDVLPDFLASHGVHIRLRA